MRPSTRLPAVRRAPAVLPVACAIGLVLLLVVVNAPNPTNGSVRNSSILPAISDPCLGAGVPTIATGTLVLTGSSTPLPSITGVTVQVDYFYTEETTVGSSSNESCVPTSATNVTGASGSIAVPLTLPPNRCADGVCVDYFGPYGPLGYATTGAPAGFFERDPTAGTSPGVIAWEADLFSAQINLTGRIVVSVNAPVYVGATASNAVGAPAPGPISYTWNLTGLSWSPSATTGPNITVEGSDSTWLGALTVTAQATYGTAVETARSAVLSLYPLATAAGPAVASPDPVDPGVPVTFYATGVGAAGYAYDLTVDPGAGTLAVQAPCASSEGPNSTVNLTCQVDAAYPSAGNVTPTGTISNGYSTATFAFLPESVRPVEQVALSSSTYITYPNRSIELTVSVSNGTGSPPYGPACVSVSGTPGLTCEDQNATSWTFPESFSVPGQYLVRAFVADHFGENVSASTGLDIVPALTARVNGSAQVTVPLNQTRALVAIVAGGELPIEARWNSSGLDLTACGGLVVSDGNVPCTFAAPALGPVNVTLTVTDALGSVATVLFQVLVIAAVVPPTVSHGTGLWAPATDIALVGLAGVATVALLLALVLRRRARAPPGGTVEEPELERMARGREHLLARADPVVPRSPAELVAGWPGPPVAPEEWAEWIATLVTEGSLVPTPGPDRPLRYRRSSPRRPTATIEFDPSVLASHRPPTEEDPDDPQGGG